MHFQYRARDADGELLEGQLEAKDRGTALDVLRQGGLTVLKLTPVGAQQRGNAAATGRSRGGALSPKKGMVFFRQLATMVKAGLGLPMSLEVLAEQEKDHSFKAVLFDVKARLDRGVPLSQAMRQHPAFSGLMVSLVQAGEEGGLLDGALEQAAGLLERQEALRGRARSAMLYPCFVIVFAICVAAVFVTFVLPKFKEFFVLMHIELPWLTEAMLRAGDYCIAHWKVIVPTALAVILLPLWLFTSRRLKPLMDRLKLKLPVFGGVVLKASLARATRTLAALTTAGVPILRGLEMAGETADNGVVRKGFADLQDGARRGVSLGDAAKQARIFPVLVSQMMRIGEETGHLDNMMDRVAAWYDQELDVQIRSMLSLLEPVLLILVGVIVALMALCLLGPVTSALSQMNIF